MPSERIVIVGADSLPPALWRPPAPRASTGTSSSSARSRGCPTSGRRSPRSGSPRTRSRTSPRSSRPPRGTTGASTPSPGGSSSQYGHRLQFVGELVGEEDVVLRGSADERRFVAFYARGGRVTAAFALDRARDVPTARALVAAGAAVPAEVLADPSASLARWTSERR